MSTPRTLVYGLPDHADTMATRDMLDDLGVPYTYVDDAHWPTMDRYPVVTVHWGGTMGSSSWHGHRPECVRALADSVHAVRT